jgi:hypothetical protein
MVMNFVSYKLCKLFMCLMHFQITFVHKPFSAIYIFPPFIPILLSLFKR